jgi:DNA-binding NtrC family response regulator
MEKILIIDDEKSVLDMLNVVFKKEGYRVKKSLSAQKALELIDEEDFDLILSDIRLPQISGMELLRKIKEKKPGTPVIMITAYGTIKQAVEAFKAGAIDYVVKPFDVEELKIVVSQGLEKIRLREENILLKKELKEKYSFKNMVGKSKKMKEIYGLIEKVAALLSWRWENPFVCLNCGALPENLLESELFGHMKGSFTGAVADKKGMFEVAEKGVLFLDEVGEMSPWTQVKLLGAIQDKIIRRVGGTEEIPVDVRIMAATNQNLKKRIEEEKFREDLFYRLNVISFEMPPLREKKEDLPLLVSHFLKNYCKKMGKKIKRIVPEVMNIFESYSWPGNVRELENLIERIVAIEDRGTITEDSLPEEILKPHKKSETNLLFNQGFRLNSHLDEIAQDYIREARQAANGNLKETASLLGVSYRTLRYLIDKYGLKSS